jgi:uncharacterized membrane protein
MVRAIQNKKEIIMDSLLKKIVWPIILIPAIYLAIVWQKLPEIIAVHFDLSGKPDRFGNRKELIMMMLILTAMNIFVYFMLTNIHRIDPRKQAVENKSRLQKIAFGVVVFMSAIIVIITDSSLKGSLQFSTRYILAAVGILFAFIGNYMYNIKPNYFAGFRLPWTLEDETNWKKTHIIASKLWFGGGLLVAALVIAIPSPLIALIVFFSITAIMAIIPIVYSYRLFRNKQLMNNPNNHI